MRSGMISHHLPYYQVLRDNLGFISCERLRYFEAFLKIKMFENAILAILLVIVVANVCEVFLVH